MKKLLLKIKNSSRRGFTVAEVAVALAVIVIISGAMLIFVASQAKVEARTVHTIEATNIAENAIECFRYMEFDGDDQDYQDYLGLLKKANPDAQISGENPFTVTKNGLTVNISITNDTEKNTTTIAINAEVNGETILGTTTFTKASP